VSETAALLFHVP